MFKNIEAEILNICKYDYKFFLNKDNVVGVGLGYKNINNITTCEKVIQVFVEKKVSSNQLNTNNLIPSFYKEIKTDVIESGIIYSTALNTRIRPVLGGYSIGPAGLYTTGSYGGLVSNGNSLFMLSNNHVLALNKLPLNHPILQQSAGDGGSSPGDVVAHLSQYIPIHFITPSTIPENFVDCAMAEIVSPNLVSPSIAFIGLPTGIETPSLGLNIECVCRTSLFSTGKITTIGASTVVNIHPYGDALFMDQIFTTLSSNPGDSGSLILTFDKKVVGLQMSGNDRVCICNPINSVLDSLNVTLVTQ